MIDEIDHSKEYEVSCDRCGDSGTFEAENWAELMDLMRREKWVSVKVGDDWEHICSDCNAPKFGAVV